MKKTVVCLALLSLLALGGQAIAEIGTIDDVPAATLLLPYFEVALTDNPGEGVNTLFSINNASAAAALVHVTLWTDESIPTLDFDIYLTGYDVQTVSLYDVFNGVVPVTADDNSDGGDAVSPQGPLSQDITFPNCNSFPYPNLPSSLVNHIRASHTGQFSSVYGGCSGADYGDNIARGYITFDNVNSCNLLFPSSTGYFGPAGVASQINQLWGDYFYVDEANNFAQGETLVHVEACPTPSVGQGADDCPFVPGDYTFYGRYVAANADDQREPLPTTFASRFVNGGNFDGGTDLIVWRDSKTTPTGANGTGGCPRQVAWAPLSQADIVAFDEFEDATDLCFQGDIFSPPTGGVDTCIPLEAQRAAVDPGSYNVPFGTAPDPPYLFGWLYLNLNTNTTPAGGQPAYGDTAAAWVTTVMSALGRFSVGYDAVALDNALDTNPTAGVILLP
jgi:hypothetical protein